MKTPKTKPKDVAMWTVTITDHDGRQMFTATVPEMHVTQSTEGWFTITNESMAAPGVTPAVKATGDTWTVSTPYKFAGSKEPPVRPSVYPVTIVATRYGGSYEGGKWAAFNLDLEDIPPGWDYGDAEAEEWWMVPPVPVAVGATPDAALAGLLVRLGATGSGR